MEDLPIHTSLSVLRESYHHIFSSGLSFSRLKDDALTDRLFPKEENISNEAPGVSGRSIAWKLFLAKHEPLQSSAPPRAESLLKELRKSRERYTQLLMEKTKPPDERLVDPVSTTKAPDPARNINLNNPLSLHNENPWNDWFAGLEVKTTISQDVERTFPEMPFFREAAAQTQLTDILFIYASTHPRIGYRQGMHELLAPLYFAAYFDSAEEGAPIEPELQEICAAKWVAADAWALFDTVMDGVSSWYEWREPDPRSLAAQSRSGISGHVHLIAQNGPNGIQPWVAPIVKSCDYIQNELLKKIDPTLWSAMQKSAIEPQIYGIRWLRMLFTREFAMTDTMKLWDGLFACDPTLGLAQWVCVAMLVRVRSRLINSDYSSQLTTLLRYPAIPKSTLDGTPTHTCLLLQQALLLQVSPTPSTAATIAMENRALLGIGIETAEFSPPSPKKRAPLTRHQSGFLPSRPANGVKEKDGMGHPGHSRQASSPPLGISEMLSRGLLERGESLGINKTLLSAVSELKRNIPDISALVKSPAPDSSSFPMGDERLPSERPPWEPRLRLEVEQETATLRSRDKRLGDALGWIVDILLQDEESSKDVEGLRKRRQEAVESLSYVRDVLISDSVDLDEERLSSEGATTMGRIREAAESPPPPDIKAPVPPPPISALSFGRNASDRKVVRAPPMSFSPNRSIMSSPSEGADLHLARSAPWNQTKSNFGNRAAVGIPSAVLPRKPPPTSSGKPSESMNLREGRKIYDDPLGVVEYSK